MFRRAFRRLCRELIRTKCQNDNLQNDQLKRDNRNLLHQANEIFGSVSGNNSLVWDKEEIVKYLSGVYSLDNFKPHGFVDCHFEIRGK